MDQRDQLVGVAILLAHRFVDALGLVGDDLRPIRRPLAVANQEDVGRGLDPLDPGRVVLAGAQPGLAMDVDDPERREERVAALVEGLEDDLLSAVLARDVERRPEPER
ncbi:MAG: hypothetical protein IPK00_16420 [Deltaproteobacteria bacterium]|nr:hypothetical protein [Deltaproteobacteria bacterium]